MKKIVFLVFSFAFVFLLAGCAKYTYRIGIPIYAENTTAYTWADEEISPRGKRITITSSNEFGDTELSLKPVEAKEENAYEPIIIAPGQSVTVDVEKGAWFKVGMRMLSNAVPEKVKYFEIKDVYVRISTAESTCNITAAVTKIDRDCGMDALYITSCDKNYVVYNWKDYIADGAMLNVGEDVEITYNGMATEENPASLCGVTNISQIMNTCATVVGRAVCIDGITYYDTGKTFPTEPYESTIEYVEIPVGRNGQTEGTIKAFARLDEGKMIVCRINDKWYEFVPEICDGVPLTLEGFSKS